MGAITRKPKINAIENGKIMNKLAIRSLLASVAIVSLSAAAVPANANESQTTPPTVQNSSNSPTLVPDGATLKIVPNRTTPGQVTPNATLIWGEASFSAGGTQAGPGNSIYASFNTNAVSENADTRVTLSGTSITNNSDGSIPTTLVLNDRMWANGLGVSVSVPFGASGSITSNGVTFSNSFAGTSYGAHNYSGITFTGALTAVNQTTTGTWTYGAQAYTAIAD